MKYNEVKFKIQAPDELRQDVSDVVSALAGEAGFETFEETDEGLTGYVQQQLFDEEQLQAVLTALPFGDDVLVSYTVGEAEDRDWNEQWEQEGFEPIVVDDRVVVHDGRHLPAETSATGHPLTAIEIDTRLAFGTGNHETTRMIIGTLLQLDLHESRVLDCGTGTGILAITALKLGAREAVGYDIDEWSTDNARHNAVINRVDDRFTTLLGDVTILNKVEGQFDVVMANINRNILLADMPAFAARLTAGGQLVLSGFYTADAPQLESKAAELGLKLRGQKSESDWCCLQLEK